MIEKFQHKKSLGQHFLNSDYVPKQMCDAAGLSGVGQNDRGPASVILEIGPGTGVLTREILNRGAKVIAVEADTRAITSLSETFPREIATKQLVVHHMDARQLDFEALDLEDHQFKIVANIPYYISGLLFRQCLENNIQPTDLVFLVQKEVAERIARSKKESILSLSVKVFGEPTYICTVKRGHFTPPPAIDSAVIAVRGISRRNFEVFKIAPTDYFEFLHFGFGQKRKQLLGNLVSTKQWSREAVEAALRAASIPSTARAEDCTLDQLLRLTHTLYTDLSID